MRDLSMRMEQIRKRISWYRNRYEKRIMAGLVAVCIALSGGIGILLRLKQRPGIFTIQTEYGTVLLHNGGEAYIVIGVFAFLAGAALTVLCMKLKAAKAASCRKEGERLK